MKALLCATRPNQTVYLVPEKKIYLVVDLELVPSTKGYLIDPQTRTVEPWAIETWKDIAPAIDAKTIEAIYLGKNLVIYVNSEGLMKPNETFELKNYPHSITGKALIFGDTGDCPLTNEQVMELLK